MVTEPSSATESVSSPATGASLTSVTVIVTVAVSHSLSGEPAVVPDDFIEQLQADADGDGLLVMPAHRLLPGEAVDITEGPLAGLQGIYTQAQGEHRALVLLDLLGGRQSVMLPTYVLQPAGAARAA